MDDLRQALDELQEAVERLPSSATAAEIAPLEDQARALLAESKNTPFEDEARQLFNELARMSSPANIPADDPELRSILRRARIRIDIASDDHDYDEAIDILARALELNADSEEAQELLMQAARRSPQHEMQVQGLFDRYDIDLELGEPERYEEPEEDFAPPATVSKEPVQVVSQQPPQPVANPQTQNLMSQLTQAYYAGDYSQAVDLANRVLAIDPSNVQAEDYRAKAEDNLVRGVVPDHRIPFDARVAYNRANSLVRAGNYDEAQRLYREARDIADRAGISTWKDVEQALLEIEDLALARELLQEGDRHLQADDWAAAQSKYEGSLRVVPNDPETEERLRLVKQVRQQYDQAVAQLGAISGSLMDRARGLTDLLNQLAQIRQILPASERLRELVHEVNNRLHGLKAQLMSQGESAMLRVESMQGIDEKLRLANEAQDLLELAVDIDPSDPKALQALQQAQQIGADLGGGRQIMDRAAALIAQNTDSELAQARQMLSGLRQQAQDPRYRLLVSDLLNRHLERVEDAIERGDVSTAERWLDITKEDPFRILGRRTEVLRFEEDIRSMKRGRSIRNGMIGALIMGIIVVGLLLLRDVWEPALFPPPTDTPTPTITFTPSATSTITLTPTGTGTPTSTPTDTEVPVNQTATAAIIQTQIAGTQAVFFDLTATVAQRNLDFTATVRAQDDEATVSAQETAIRSTSIARTQEVQSTLNRANTLTVQAFTATPSETMTLTPT
ncbi:MAG: tetratricopeptide repeat protein, partial [Chloroflexi bacterium]|nr:tetratricopeptide repeat protein [Chloroflexota bacterium]